MPDFKPIGAQVHFKCAFDIDARTLSEPMTVLRQVVRQWCIDRKDCLDDDRDILRPWFYLGTHPQYGGAFHVIGDNQIRVATVPGENPNEPIAWGMELIHPDSAEPARRWAAEVFFRQDAHECIRFSTVVSHWMIPNYIGEYGELPVTSVPGYVRAILMHVSLTCSKGSTRVSRQFVPVTTDNAQDIYEHLADKDRGLPYVFVAGEDDGSTLAADPVLLYRYLLGNANVFAFFDATALDEMNYYLGNKYRCEPGTLRCYQTRFDRLRIDNPKLHRFFDREFLAEKGPRHAAELLANGLARNGASLRGDDFASLDDVFAARRKHRIKVLAREAAEATDAADKATKEQVAADAEKEYYFEVGAENEAKNEKLEATIAVLEEENAALREKQYDLITRVAESDELRRQVIGLQKVAEQIPKLATFPKTLADVVEVVGHLFPDRLVFTADARQAAAAHEKKNDFWRKPEGSQIAWEMLMHLATLGHDTMFTTQITAKAVHFHGNSGYEMALSEGKMTKDDRQLANLRKIGFEGKQYDISPHIKFGNRPPKVLRIYFAADTENRRLIIGHCGDHLATAGTRRIS